jgi:hypothetical protein
MSQVSSSHRVDPGGNEHSDSDSRKEEYTVFCDKGGLADVVVSRRSLFRDPNFPMTTRWLL